MTTNFANETYRPSESALAAELMRKYGVQPHGKYVVRKGNATPQEFSSYVLASEYLLKYGGVLSYKIIPAK